MTTEPLSNDLSAPPELGVVSRCICYNKSFAELADLSEREGCGIAGIHAQTGVGARCGLCIPYIRLMLRTGKTSLPVMWSRDFEDQGVPPDPLRRMERHIGVDGRGKTAGG
ncbi:MAG: hypothetical protein AAGB51_13675 [Planctomycetota bacterium]